MLRPSHFGKAATETPIAQRNRTTERQSRNRTTARTAQPTHRAAKPQPKHRSHSATEPPRAKADTYGQEGHGCISFEEAPKLNTEEVLKGHDYLKSRSSRSSSGN